MECKYRIAYFNKAALVWQQWCSSGWWEVAVGAGGYKLSRVAPTGLYILTSLLYVVGYILYILYLIMYVVVHILHSISYNVRCTIQQMKIFIFHGRLCTAPNQLLYFEFYVQYNCTLNQVRASVGLSRASPPLDQGGG